MIDNENNRQFSLTMNFYLLSSILIAVCHLTLGADTYGKVVFFTCTRSNPPINCPYTFKPQCDNYCAVLESYMERLSAHNRQCPYSFDVLLCPNDDAVDCMKFCNTAANYRGR